MYIGYFLTFYWYMRRAYRALGRLPYEQYR